MYMVTFVYCYCVKFSLFNVKMSNGAAVSQVVSEYTWLSVLTRGRLTNAFAVSSISAVSSVPYIRIPAINH